MSLADDLKAEILRSIQTEGVSSEDNKVFSVVIASRSNTANIINPASGTPRIRPNVLKKFELILARPAVLSALSPLAIRCCLCHKVIAYPAWYMRIQYAVNHFHYFVCFNPAVPENVTAKCYKR